MNAISILTLSAFLAPLAAQAQQQVDEQLIGTWVGTGAANRGARVVVARDHVVIDGMRMPWRLVGVGQLEIGPRGESERASYQLRGGVLTIRDSEETTTWRREGGRPQAGGNPLEEQGPRRVDPFAREFRGQEIRLVLSRGAAGYQGQLTLRGRSYPVQVRAEGQRLVGSFQHKGRSFAMTATLQGDTLTLQSGRSTYKMTAGGSAARPGLQTRNSQPQQRNVVVLKKRVFHDPGFGGIHSHTMFVPADWRGNAGVRWTASEGNFVQFVGSFAGPDGSSITFDYNRSVCNSTSQTFLQQLRMQAANDRSGYSEIAWPPQQRGQMAVERIVPRLRPSARNLQLVDVKNIPEAEAMLRKQMAPMIQVLQRGHTMTCHVERAFVTYEEGGQQWEEMVQYVMVINKVCFRGMYVNYDTGMTGVTSVRTFRAPRGTLQARLPQLQSIADTLRPTPRWSLSLNRLRMEISKIKHRGRMNRIQMAGQRAKMIAKTYSEISDMQMSSWRRKQASSDRIQKARVNSIRGVHDYRSTDGTEVQVDHSYDRVFQDGQGNLLMTNDVNYDPRSDVNVSGQNWTQLSRIRHLGG